MQKIPAKQPSHFEKNTKHKFCVDTSKHLIKNPKLIKGKTPIPNRVVSEIPHVRSDPDLLGATPQTMSSLRDYDSDTDRILSDENSFNISEDECENQTHYSSQDNITLEGHQIQLQTESIIDTGLCNLSHRLPKHEAIDRVNLSIEKNEPYWRELIRYCKNKHIALDTCNIREYCKVKKNSEETDKKSKEYFTKMLMHLMTNKL